MSINTTSNIPPGRSRTVTPAFIDALRAEGVRVIDIDRETGGGADPCADFDPLPSPAALSDPAALAAHEGAVRNAILRLLRRRRPDLMWHADLSPVVASAIRSIVQDKASLREIPDLGARWDVIVSGLARVLDAMTAADLDKVATGPHGEARR